MSIIVLIGLTTQVSVYTILLFCSTTLYLQTMLWQQKLTAVPRQKGRPQREEAQAGAPSAIKLVDEQDSEL